METTDDAAVALTAIEPRLVSSAVEYNLVATILGRCAKYPGIGRYWWSALGQQVEGVVVQAPAGTRAVITPAPTEVIASLADAVATAGVGASGVFGEAAAAAAFAGRWAEVVGEPVSPSEGGRLYRLGELCPPKGVEGVLRRALVPDTDLAITWLRAFHASGGNPSDHTPGEVHWAISEGQLWLWEVDGQPVSMVCSPPVVAGVARIQWVYTPPEHRRHGYGAAVVAALSEQLITSEAETCILYTQLANPSSNAMYKRLGYQAEAEVLSYRFA